MEVEAKEGKRISPIEPCTRTWCEKRKVGKRLPLSWLSESTTAVKREKTIEQKQRMSRKRGRMDGGIKENLFPFCLTSVSDCFGRVAVFTTYRYPLIYSEDRFLPHINTLLRTQKTGSDG